MSQKPLNLHSCFGVNKTDLNSVVYCSNEKNEEIVFYSSANYITVENLSTNERHFLAGHRKKVNNLEFLTDNFLCSTDHKMIVWDFLLKIPVFTFIYDFQKEMKILHLAVKENKIALLYEKCENEETGETQLVVVLEWQKDALKCSKLFEFSLNFDEVLTTISFNPFNFNELVLSSVVSFVVLENSNKRTVASSPKMKGLKIKLADFRIAIFISKNSFIGFCSDGHGIVFDKINPSTGFQCTKALKFSNCGILNAFFLLEKYICISDEAGNLKVFDGNFKIVLWFDSVDAKGVKSFDFQKSNGNFDIKIEERQNIENLPNLVVVTNSAKIYKINTFSFFSDKIEAQLLQSFLPSDAKSVSVFVEKFAFLTAEDGFLYIFDLEAKKFIFSQILNEICYGTKSVLFGNTFLVGYSNGCVQAFKISLENDQSKALPDPPPPPFQLTPQALLRNGVEGVCGMAVNDQLDRFAVCLLDFAVILYRHNSESDAWQFSGKCRPHTRPVKDLKFFDSNLFSCGEDGRLNIFNVQQSNEFSNLIIDSTFELTDEGHYPTALHEDVGGENGGGVLIFTSNLKILTFDKSKRRILKIVDCSLFNGDLKAFQNLEDKKTLLLCYDKKCLGIAKFPLDGSPSGYFGGIFFHDEIFESFVYKNDEKIFILVVSKNGLVSIFSHFVENFQTETEKMGESGNEKFVQILQGEGLWEKVEDFFHLSQLKMVGPFKKDFKILPGHITLAEIVPLLCVLGFFPSQKDVENLCNEIETFLGKDKILIGDFARIFYNHRKGCLDMKELKNCMEMDGITVEMLTEELLKSGSSCEFSKDEILRFLEVSGKE